MLARCFFFGFGEVGIIGRDEGPEFLFCELRLFVASLVVNVEV